MEGKIRRRIEREDGGKKDRGCINERVKDGYETVLMKREKKGESMKAWTKRDENSNFRKEWRDQMTSHFLFFENRGGQGEYGADIYDILEEIFLGFILQSCLKSTAYLNTVLVVY